MSEEKSIRVREYTEFFFDHAEMRGYSISNNIKRITTSTSRSTRIWEGQQLVFFTAFAQPLRVLDNMWCSKTSCVF